MEILELKNIAVEDKNSAVGFTPDKTQLKRGIVDWKVGQKEIDLCSQRQRIENTGKSVRDIWNMMEDTNMCNWSP